MEHIQQMGEGNCNWNRQLHVGSETMIAAAAIYQQLYQLKDGSIPATFQLISMIGWKPDPNKLPKACQRGSAQHSLKDLGNVHS
jgi:NADH dehydrogenase [ubiquinone] 1 alpha subcomplex assembly factor 5